MTNLLPRHRSLTACLLLAALATGLGLAQARKPPGNRSVGGQ
jgi:hypothetical protein